MDGPRYCFDERCLELARYFYPNVADVLLRPLAQQLQDAVESFPLSRCALRSCDVEFVPAGNERYCCKEHAEQANREFCRIRVARWRARKRGELNERRA